MHAVINVCALALCFAAPIAAQSAVFESVRAAQDIAPSTNPAVAFWRAARPVFADKGPNGESHERYRTEIRSRWTEKYLYLLFICPYDTLHLKPSPDTRSETNELWNWDVAEAFIGSDFQNIQRYKEFEISPQGEWIDLDIDLTKPHHEDGWKWNSGFVVSARIDASAKIWYGVMKIPFSSLERRPPAEGQAFRINLFRSQGDAADRVQIAWQPTMSHTFHVPEKFGVLRLAGPAR
jgi:hypothetical protein